MSDELSSKHRSRLQSFLAGKPPTAGLIETLSYIAGHVTSSEGDREQTEDDFGLDADEVVEMAHDNMIESARLALKLFADSLPSIQQGE